MIKVLVQQSEALKNGSTAISERTIMERFYGDKADELFRFMNTISPDLMKPMSDEEISAVCSALHISRLPELFTYFLRTAGTHFRPWKGFDYKLVDETGCFIDYAEEVKEEEILDRRFRKYGFDYKDCLFFLNNGGVQYFFIRLDGESDPLVYAVDMVAIQEEPAEAIRLSELLIVSYNEMVTLGDGLDDPWLDSSMRTAVINLIENHFPFKSNEKFAIKSSQYSKYRIRQADHNLNCIQYLNSFLKENLNEINCIFVYSEKRLYTYFFRMDKQLENHIGLDIYKDQTAFFDTEFEWGWFTVGDTVYIFGEDFIQKIRDHFDSFSLMEF